MINLVSKGYMNKEIAEKLHISERTVKQHLHHVYRILGFEAFTGRFRVCEWVKDLRTINEFLEALSFREKGETNEK